MQNLHITCDNLEQRQNVFNVLDGMGLKHICASGDYLQINAEINLPEPREYMTVVEGSVWPNSQILNYTQFMEQYSMQTLRNTIKKSGLSNPELSIKLGHSRKYLTNLLNDGCSTELQNRLIEEINQVMAGTFKTDAEVIAELTEKLSEAQDKYNELNNRAIGDMLDKNTAIEELQAESDKYFTENQTLRKNAQDADMTIQARNSVIASRDRYIDELRATASKQNALNESLNTECAELAEKLGFKTKQLSERNDEINKLRQSQKIHRLLSMVCLAAIILLTVIQWGV